MKQNNQKHEKYYYICNVFFIVLDLRLTME